MDKYKQFVNEELNIKNNVPNDFNWIIYRNYNDKTIKTYNDAVKSYKKNILYKDNNDNINNDINVINVSNIDIDVINVSNIIKVKDDNDRVRYKDFIPNDFNYISYINLNPDLNINSEKDAKNHYINYGYKENRKYSYNDYKKILEEKEINNELNKIKINNELNKIKINNELNKIVNIKKSVFITEEPVINITEPLPINNINTEKPIINTINNNNNVNTEKPLINTINNNVNNIINNINLLKEYNELNSIKYKTNIYELYNNQLLLNHNNLMKNTEKPIIKLKIKLKPIIKLKNDNNKNAIINVINNNSDLELVIHYIYGINEVITNFEYYHYLSILTTYENHPNAKIYFHYTKLPDLDNEYFNCIKQYLILNKINYEYPKNCFTHFYHKEEYIKLKILYDYGGLYIDMDTICNKPFLLIDNNILTIENNYEGINSFLIYVKNKNNDIILKWIKSYNNFNKYIWNYNCSLYPLIHFKDEITLLSKNIYPHWVANYNDLYNNEQIYTKLYESINYKYL
jgi:hypothetical protein